MDNYVHFGEGVESFVNKIKDLASQGGGNLALAQHLNIGGKAANCASALSALGLRPSLIAKTDELGYRMLQHMVEGRNIDISHVSSDGSLAFTTAIELEGANIMLSDQGSLADFGPDYLTEKDLELIEKADFVCISDWGLNRKGTELARHVFDLVKTKGKGKTFFDPGDPSPKKDKIDEEIECMIKDILEEGLVDILSVNEDEVERYGGLDELRQLCRVDLHTDTFSASYHREKESKQIPAFDVMPRRLTGAGDAWNAGDILGDALGLADELRLLLANAAAGFYISSSDGKHPQRRELTELIRHKYPINTLQACN
jgi:ribokinase